MASNLNSVTLSGRLTRDPELKHMPSGDPVVEMGLAVNRSRKVNEEWVEEVSFFDISSFKRAENIAAKLRKGDSVSLVGELRQRTWETNEGAKREKVSVIAQSMESEGFFRPQSENNDVTVALDEEPAMAGSAQDDEIPF
jgi:single-strand DNA-binding protein